MVHASASTNHYHKKKRPSANPFAQGGKYNGGLASLLWLVGNENSVLVIHSI